MGSRDPRLEAAFSELSNALQAALPLSSTVLAASGEAAEDLVMLEATLKRAVTAVREIRELERATR
jgi:hypothetical protein